MKKKLLLPSFLFLGSILLGVSLYSYFPVAIHYFRKNCWLNPRSQSEQVQCLSKLNIDIVPTHLFYSQHPFKSEGTEFVTLSGIPNSKTLLCKEGKDWESFDSDSRGYSNPEAIWNEATISAVMLGDSFLIGECVPKEQRFSTIVQTQQSNVLNLGYPKSSLLSEWARFTEYGAARKPKHILLFYYEQNDPSELMEELANPFLKQYINDPKFSQDLEGKREIVESLLKPWMFEFIKRNPEPVNISHLFKNLLLNRDANAQQAIPTAFSLTGPIPRTLDKIFSYFSIWATRNQATVSLFYLPAKGAENRFFLEGLREILEKNKIAFINMQKEFEKFRLDPYSGFEPFHYNSKANELIAEKVLEVITYRETTHRN